MSFNNILIYDIVKHNFLFLIFICHGLKILYKWGMKTATFYPKTHLFPHHPQILHQMVLQLFLFTDGQGDNFPTENMPHAMVMPYGSYFDTGAVQATGYRYRLGFHKPKHVVVIAFADLPEEVTLLGSNYQELHTFFGALPAAQSAYKKLGVTIDNSLFAQHADPIICQLPFLRSYQKIESITPLIINTQKTDHDRKKVWSALRDKTGATCYVLCTNLIDNSIAALTQGYQSITSEEFLMFDPKRKTS